MDNDVSVTRLSGGDGWSDRVPPEPRSRLRVIAVMGAVVLGCGVAAVAVNSMPGDDRRIQKPDDAAVIMFPNETTDIGTDVTPTSADASSTGSTPTDSSETETPSDTASTDPDTDERPTPGASSTLATTSTAPTEPAPPPPDDPDPSPPQSSQPQPPTTTTTPRDRDDRCRWWLFC